MPGTAFIMVSPDELAVLRPHTVLVANPEYVAEISTSLADLGLDCDVLPLWGAAADADGLA